MQCSDPQVITTLLKRYSLTEEDCCKQVSDIHLDEFSRNCCSNEWQSLPTHLEVERVTASDIDWDLRSEREKRQTFFSEWKQRKGSDATYRTLVHALLKINHRDDAEYLCKLLLRTSTCRATSTTITMMTVSAASDAMTTTTPLTASTVNNSELDGKASITGRHVICNRSIRTTITVEPLNVGTFVT